LVLISYAFQKKALGNDKPKAYGTTLGKKGAG
jgi:hypothetical protein